jgi:triosephosphate isomerase
MRTPIVAGNWKMNKTVSQARDLVFELIPELTSIAGVDSIICPPYAALYAIKELLSRTDIGLGAQNMYWKASGAFTGEISPMMVAELCDYVIIGHSERRQYFGETDQTVNHRVHAALAAGLTPIVCIGETLEEMDSGKTAQVVTRQVNEGLMGLSAEEGMRLIVAYEPVWAIGTGRAATAESANQVHADIVRASLHALFNAEVAASIRILYGGSVKPNNAAEYFAQTDIDGALVGGASLKAQDFVAITKAAVA